MSAKSSKMDNYLSLRGKVSEMALNLAIFNRYKQVIVLIYILIYYINYIFEEFRNKLQAELT